MECLDFDDISSVDLIAGMKVNPGCTPIKFSHSANEDQVFEDYGKNQIPCPVNTTYTQSSSSTPPSILRRGKYRQHRGIDLDVELIAPYDQEETSLDSETQDDLEAQPFPTTPVRLPYENLPFSPSQFLNSSCQYSSCKLTSTPVVSQTTHNYSSIHSAELHTPRNPYLAQQSFSPRTPTPFKHAIAEVERRAQSKSWSPSDLDDLGEVLKECDMGFQADHADFEADHTGYEADQSSGFTPMSQTQQPKRKFNRESANHRQEKVQKKSVKKIVFTDSPPKDTAPNAVTLDPSYQKVACGLTKDQLDMTQLAKSYYL